MTEAKASESPLSSESLKRHSVYHHQDQAKHHRMDGKYDI